MRADGTITANRFRTEKGLGFTLVELLVVLGIIGLLASILSVAVVQARKLSVRTECQEHLRQIGSAFQQIALDRSGAYPELEDDKDIPWWAYVYEELHGDMKSLDTNLTTDDLQLPSQLPGTLNILHCRAGAALDGTSADNLRRSISYGLNFDVRDSDDRIYHTHSSTDPYSARFYPDPTALTPADKNADPIHQADIRKHGAFVLISEANSGYLDMDRDRVPEWTGGRISMTAIGRTNAADDPRGNAPIAGRHGGYANVLFADLHVEVYEAYESSDMPGPDAPPGSRPARRGINEESHLWTLPQDQAP